jgi:hypothetical protein
MPKANPKNFKDKLTIFLIRNYKPLMYIGMAVFIYILFAALTPLVIADEIIAEIIYIVIIAVAEITAKIKASKK